jgi:predicted CoA-binding protein
VNEQSIEERILREYRTIAVVGLSSNPERTSYGVASCLARHGYHIIPVNPTAAEIMGETSYPDLSSVPEKVEVVDIFRKPEDVMPVVEEAIKIKAKAVWMQEGIVNEEAAAKARDAGLLVVMDRCICKEYRRMSDKKAKRGI